MGGFMIEIAPILITQPIIKIKKVVHEGKKEPEQNQPQEQNNEEDDGPEEPGQQHIDEIV